MATINERIQKLVDETCNGNVSEFARRTGLKQPTLNTILGERKSKPSYDVLNAIATNTQVNASWLLTGEGEVLSHGIPIHKWNHIDLKTAKKKFVFILQALGIESSIIIQKCNLSDSFFTDDSDFPVQLKEFIHRYPEYERYILDNICIISDLFPRNTIDNEDIIVYHYTSAYNAIKIIESKKINFGVLGNSNDYREKSKAEEDEESFVCFCMGNKTVAGYQKARMWTQYGDENQGVCIGFNLKKLIEKNPGIEHFPITYVPNYVNVWTMFLKQWYYYKIKDWENETEYRFAQKGKENASLDIESCIEHVIAGVYIYNDEKRKLSQIDSCDVYGINQRIFSTYGELCSLGHKMFYRLNGNNYNYEEIPIEVGKIIADEEVYAAYKGKKIKLLPHSDFKFAAGNVQLYPITKEIKKYWYLPDCSDCDGIIQVVGNSMYPMLPSGSFVALKRYSYSLDRANQIPFGSVFGVVVEDPVTNEYHGYIKILRKHKSPDMASRYWIAHSVNEDEFDDFDIDIQQVRGLWIVKKHVVSDAI